MFPMLMPVPGQSFGGNTILFGKWDGGWIGEWRNSIREF